MPDLLIVGDGESDEAWLEARCSPPTSAGHLIAFTDCNKLQIDGATAEVMRLEDLREKWPLRLNAVGVDGHDFASWTRRSKRPNGRAASRMIILDTVMGKGCSFCEGQSASHNMTITPDRRKKRSRAG
jgi:transketolase